MGVENRRQHSFVVRPFRDGRAGARLIPSSARGMRGRSGPCLRQGREEERGKQACRQQGAGWAAGKGSFPCSQPALPQRPARAQPSSCKLDL